MGLLGYLFSNVKIGIVSDDNNYYLKIGSKDYEYQFNCYSGNKDNKKKEVGTSESVKKLDIKGDDDNSKLVDGTASPTAFNNATVSDKNNNSESLEQNEEDQNDLNNDQKTPVINDEDSYLSDTTLCSTSSEIDDLDADKSERHSNSHKMSRKSSSSPIKVNSNGRLQLSKDSGSTSLSKVDATATANKRSKVTWRTLGCPHGNQDISPLSYDNEKSLQFCHLCLQELVPM